MRQRASTNLLLWYSTVLVQCIDTVVQTPVRSRVLIVYWGVPYCVVYSAVRVTIVQYRESFGAVF